MAVKDVLSLIPEIILHPYSFLLLPVFLLSEYISGYGSSKCGSVLAALSRIEELDFGHEVCDVTTRARARFCW